ncbi:MAG: hypothetical protein ACPGYV_08515 [Phycisphaeraceae bacterium]
MRVCQLFKLLVVGLLLSGSGAFAQLVSVEIDIQRDFLGLGGIVQRGTWTPVRVDLTNTSAENVEVHCRWLLTDEDGDTLVSERSNITLQPQRTQRVWLYAVPPMSTRPNETWVFQAVSVTDGELIDQAQLQLTDSAVAEPSVNLVGLCGFKGLGLNPWQRWSTHHEQLRLVRGLSLETLPDRWYGLDGLSSLVWFPIEGGEPTDSRMSDSSRRALREWVYRGGHLVLVLPYAGQQWTGADSKLGDLLDPIDASSIKQTRARVPLSVFGLLRNSEPVPVMWFDLEDAPGYTTLAEVDVSPTSAALPDGVSAPPAELKPLIVGKRMGFGQVTLVGIDLSDPGVLQSIDAFRLHRVWTRIFNWRASKTGELYPNSELDNPNPQISGQYYEAKNASKIELGTWIASRVAREGQTGPAVGLAFVLFVLYAIAAALTFPNLLKARGWQRHSWMLFVSIVALFSIVAWGGAAIMRPATTSVAHFTVLDIDGNTNLVRAKSWQSLLIPSFADADIQVPSDPEGFNRMELVNLLANPGHELNPDSPGYPDQRTYRYDAARPDQLAVPMRSTTKSLRVEYLGQITAPQPGLREPWDMPQASITVVNRNGVDIPDGTITHQFPGELTDVRIIFCPGGAQQPAPPGASRAPNRPLVYEYKAANNLSIWRPGTPMVLPASPNVYSPLWVRPRLSTKARIWRDEGFLGQQIAQRGFSVGNASNSNIVKDLPLLSFYSALPPPVYHVQQGNLVGGIVQSPYNVYSRSLVRDLDLSHLITGRRLIIIGHLRESPSPVPLTVDGDDIPSKGWTVVRWIYDF